MPDDSAQRKSEAEWRQSLTQEKRQGVYQCVCCGSANSGGRDG